MKLKKKMPFLLIVPLVLAGILFSTCFCPMADASVVEQPAFQASHHCCCSDAIQPSIPAVLSDQAVSPPSFDQKDMSSLLLAHVAFPILEVNSASDFNFFHLQLFHPQDIFLKSKVLRI